MFMLCNPMETILFSGKERRLSCLTLLYSWTPSTQFKCKQGVNFDFTTRKVDFLDTTIWVDDNGVIQSTLYTKPGKVVQYLSPSSSHPSHITKNIPYSLAYRLLRIETTRHLFEANLEKLGSDLVQRGYRKDGINDAFNKVRNLDRQTTLQKVVRPPSDRLILVIPFDKRLPNISSILKHRWKCLVERDPKATQYMPKPPMVAYSRTESIKDIACRSKVPPTNYRQRRQVTMGFQKCGKRVDCSVCLHSTNSASHTCNFTGNTYNINSGISCLTPGVVYTVSCSKDTGACSRVKGPQYVGVTERPLKVRFSEHVGSATQPCQVDTTKPVGLHFRLQGHSHSDMVILPIEKVRSKDRFIMEARESYWIKQYKSVKVQTAEEIEHGLNLKPWTDNRNTLWSC